MFRDGFDWYPDSQPQRKVHARNGMKTQDQTTANQERELRQIAERVGYEIVKVYKDHGISGAPGSLEDGLL